MLLIKDFPFLNKLQQPFPKMLRESLGHDGLLEHKGIGSNPSILKWAMELGQSVADVYKSDDIPWCGLYMGILAQRCGYALPKDPLWALSWKNFGVKIDVPKFGDVLTYKRNGGGHTHLYVAESADAYLGHGGNQSDAVCFTWMPKNRLVAACHPEWAIGPQQSRQRYFVNRNGELSTNEQ